MTNSNTTTGSDGSHGTTARGNDQLEFTIGDNEFIEENGKYPHRWEGLHGGGHAHTGEVSLEIDRGSFTDIHADVSFTSGNVSIGGDINSEQSDIGLLVNLTPKQAREFAASVLDAATRAEELEGDSHE